MPGAHSDWGAILVNQFIQPWHPDPAWYCLRSQPKHEHIAALHLRRRIEGIDVFCPRLRIRKRTRRGAVWFVEALFPSYLFAWFNPAEAMQSVKSTPGISSIVSFGLWTPSISPEIINQLRADFDQNEVHEVHDDLKPGDNVTIASGPFQGFKAEVIRVLPGPQRVQVLMNMLGRTTPVEVSRNEIVAQKSVPRLLAKKEGFLVPSSKESLRLSAAEMGGSGLDNLEPCSARVVEGQQRSR